MSKAIRSRSSSGQASTDQEEDHLAVKCPRKVKKGAQASRPFAEEEGDLHIVPTASAFNTLAASVFEFLEANSFTEKDALVTALMDPQSKLGLTTDPSDQINICDMLAYKAHHKREDGDPELLEGLQIMAQQIAAANVLPTVPKYEFLKMFRTNFGGDSRRPFVHFGMGSSTAMLRLEVPFPRRALGHYFEEELPQLEDSKMMPVLFGESGSGKTHTAMSSNCGGLVVYLLLGIDMEDKFRRRLKKHDESEGVSPPTNGDGPGFKRIDDDHPMLSEFVDDVKARCNLAMHYGTTKEMKKVNVPEQMKDVVVRLVADELGDKPSVLRLFIRTRDALRDAIREELNCKAVKLLAVGTGTNERVALGSNANSYTAFTLDAGDTEFVEWLLGWITVVSNKFRPALAKMVMNHRSLGALVQNRRAAVLVVKHLAPVLRAAPVTSVEQLTSLVNETADAVATSAAFDYKSMNALERLDHNQMKRVALDAIEIVRSGTELRADELRRFSACYGILVNASDDPGEQKLALSPAMRALLLVHLGCPQHGKETLVQVLAKKCAVALLTTRDPKLLSEMLYATAMVAVPKRSPTTVSPRPDVVMMELTHRLAGAANATQVTATLQAVEIHVNKGKAVVVINGSEAPYADVVAVTKGFVGFFRSKDTGRIAPNSEANKLHTQKEEDVGMTSQGVTSELCRIAGVELKSVRLVIVSSAGSRRGNKDIKLRNGAEPAVEVYRCESDDEMSFLFPFEWPEEDAKAHVEFSAAAFDAN